MIQTFGRFLIRLGRRLAPDATYSGSTVEREVAEIRAASGIGNSYALRNLLAREEAQKAERAVAGPPPGQVADLTPAVIGAETDGEGYERVVVRGRAGVLEFGSARPIDPLPDTKPSFADLNGARDLTQTLEVADAAAASASLPDDLKRVVRDAFADEEA